MGKSTPVGICLMKHKNEVTVQFLKPVTVKILDGMKDCEQAQL